MQRKSIFELVTVVGAVVLFLCWIYQQSVVEKLERDATFLKAAEDEYVEYQSNNAIFNAIVATTSDAKIITSIRQFQTYNYGLGLRKLAQAAGVSTVGGYDVSLTEMQTYLEKIQEIIRQKKKRIEREGNFKRFMFNLGYALGSFLTVAGSVLKLTLPSDGK